MLRFLSIILTLLALAPAARPGDKPQAAQPTEQLKAPGAARSLYSRR